MIQGDAQREPATYRDERSRSRIGTLLQVGVLVAALLFFALRAWLLQQRLQGPLPHALIDFNDFHVVARMVAAGRAAQAYDWPLLQAEQLAQTGAWAFMPWAYPPPFTLLMGGFGVLPIWAAYFLFSAATWLLFQSALLRLCGNASVPALLIVMPALLINAYCGQNGFLTGGLIGWSLVGLRERTSRGGWPLGLMIIKPHLAAGVGLLALLGQRWATVARAASSAVGLCLLSTAVLGPAIWIAARNGAAVSSEALWSGQFPLERMTSVFAAMHRFGVAPPLAMAIHLVFALCGVFLLIAAVMRKVERDLLLALGAAVTLIIGPYNYDYDMVTLAFAVGLVLPRFLARARVAEAILLVLLSWIGLSNYLWVGLRQIWYGVPKIEASMHLWTISPLALIAMAALVTSVLRRRSAASRYLPALGRQLAGRGGGRPVEPDDAHHRTA
jgi:hypothetical protein